MQDDTLEWLTPPSRFGRLFLIFVVFACVLLFRKFQLEDEVALARIPTSPKIGEKWGTRVIFEFRLTNKT